MRQIVCKQEGPPEDLVLEDVAAPVAGPGQVVLDVAAAGVNYVDALFVQGRYQVKPPVPFVPGGEVAGTVSSVGPGVEGWDEGDRVMAMTGMGGFAEKVLLPATSLVRIGASMDFGRAASFTQSYCTGLFALDRRAKLRAGETLLVLGAGGGVGLAAIDIGRALGARVLAAASSRDKLAAAQAMGAEAGIDYETEDLKTRARELSGDGRGGVDVVYDAVGGKHAEPALRATRVGGRFLVIGFASGTIPSLPLNQVLLNNRSVVGVDWGGWGTRHPGDNQALLVELLQMVEEGRLTPPAPATVPLERAGAALRDLLERRVTGKVVLTTSG
ncbi:MAG: NADPH:quinone oxidoreductase family protein [Acidimicrobiales bacterium]